MNGFLNSLSGKLVFGIVTVILAMWISPKGFNEPTQAYHLAHCYHHEPVSMLAQMLILMLGFVLFSAFAQVHSILVWLGKMTAKTLAQELNLALEADLPWEQRLAFG